MATVQDPHLMPIRHALAIGHPIVQSFEPGEDWRWCYVDEADV